MVKLLLVDDDEAIHALIREQIRVSGIDTIEVVSACSGKEGVDKYSSENPDIVIMDLKMPGDDGAVATRRILHKHPDAKIIILTGYPDTVLASDSFNSGAFALVKKVGKFAAIIIAFAVACANGNILD